MNYLDYNCEVRLNECRFIKNKAEISGGGIHYEHVKVIIDEQTTFEENEVLE